MFFTFNGDDDIRHVERNAHNMNDLISEVGGFQAILLISFGVLNEIISSFRAKVNIASLLFKRSRFADEPETLDKRYMWLSGVKPITLGYFEALKHIPWCCMCRDKKDTRFKSMVDRSEKRFENLLDVRNIMQLHVKVHFMAKLLMTKQ
jgi:hypothetical protein